ncbi:DNA polymerase alpha subunit B isoform X1 [Sceloporus undulatus]|uniref:DNA polymerase alpha subunit B isoform X1 n=1 Tax=Sceloporus undulatus TaxID=8520 RepID=UPI001C4A95F8|nr:DNA polymerase alpha subunit B isoform X1 [Sceloporus undulatus]
MASPVLEAVKGELKMFGLDFAEEEEEPALAEKLEELCLLHRMKETELAEELIAFAATKGTVSLTANFLLDFQYNVLNKQSVKPPVKKETHSSGTKETDIVPGQADLDEDDEDLLDAYTSPSKATQKQEIKTPENPRSKRTLSTRSPHLAFSPNSFSPSATPSQKYSSRSHRGEVVTSFGSVQGTSWSGNGGLKTTVAPFGEPLTKPYKFMFQDLMENRDVLSYKIEELGEALKEHYKIEEFSSLTIPVQNQVTVLGRIGCDSNGKLNAKSIVLEGDQEHSSGGLLPVDVSELPEYSLFPGQVVVMEGINSTGKQFFASKLYEGVPLPFLKPPELDEDSEPQMVLVACGPYTTSDSITYDPMLDLINVINKDKPDVCILLGPFLDAKHKQVEDCQFTSSFEDIFKLCMKTIIEGTRSAGSRLVIVPSLRDVHHFYIYPQPPFSYDLSKEDEKRVLFVSDPCTLEINGVLLGLTSVDLLFHMGSEEISSSSSVLDRFSRILKHILTQRSYYPLYPPAEEMNIDYEHFYPYASLPVMPDVLVTPSDLKYFIKDILHCVCVNPGRLTKGHVGGTYGRLWLQRKASREECQNPCVSAQVVRI